MSTSMKTSIQTTVGSHVDKNGTRAVYYKVYTHNTQKSINTGVRVTNDEVSADGKTIRNYRKASMLERKRLEMLDKVYELELEALGVRDISAEYIVARITTVAMQVEFFSFADMWIKRSRISENSKNNYNTMLNKLEKYLGRRKLSFDEITYSFLTRWENALRDEGIVRLGHYLGGMRHVYREAMLEYNTDYDQVIRNDPFARYRVPRQMPRKGVRALTLEELMKIYNYTPKRNTRAELARDLFIMSFCLMGMNIPDFHEVDNGKDGILRYKRHKTRMRRADEAYIEVKVHPIIDPLMKRYKGRMRVFCFYARYKHYQDLGRAVNIGLKTMAEELGFDNLQFYQARHTFATLSRNLMKFAKSDVDEALNHKSGYGLADVYIAKDFTIINENNKKLLDEVFKDYLVQ